LLPNGDRTMQVENKLRFGEPRREAVARLGSVHGAATVSDQLFLIRADEICMVHYLITGQFNHSTGQLMLNCGNAQVGRPSMGARTVYGLGSESRNLPAYIVLGKATAAASDVWLLAGNRPGPPAGDGPVGLDRPFHKRKPAG
jgi:hypothetical protein